MTEIIKKLIKVINHKQFCILMYLKFLNKLKSRSIKDYNIELTAEDQIITLSTCGKEKKYRVVLHAKKI